MDIIFYSVTGLRYISRILSRFMEQAGDGSPALFYIRPTFVFEFYHHEQ